MKRFVSFSSFLIRNAGYPWRPEEPTENTQSKTSYRNFDKLKTFSTVNVLLSHFKSSPSPISVTYNISPLIKILRSSRSVYPDGGDVLFRDVTY